MARISACIIFCFLILLQPFVTVGQSFDTEFGKNRVQYNDDFKYWSQYESPNFIVYWYGKGKNVAHTIIQMAELDHDIIRKQVEHRISDKIEILVYVDLSDFKQSNIGGEEVFQSESGETKIVVSKMLVYFDGSHVNLREKIREGIASVYLSSMLFGSNFQEVVQNAVLLDLPAWYKPGFVSYAGNAWNITVEDELRNLLASKPKFYDFEKFSQKHPRIAGHSMWYYLRTNYGRSTVSNLLYLTRITRNFEKSVEFVLNTPLKQIYAEWSVYYQSRFALEAGRFDEISGKELKIKKKKNQPITAISPSKDGKWLLYALNNAGKSCVYLRNNATGKTKRLFSSHFKNMFQEADLEYPHFCWNDKSNEFIVSTQNRDNIYLRRYQVNDLSYQVQLLPNEVQRLYAVDFVDNRYLMLNAAIDGFSDLMLYDTKDRETLPITSDYFDDLHASVVDYQGSKAILFCSNRTVEHILPMKLDTILPLGEMDVFLYPLPTIKDKNDLKLIPRSLERLTQTLQDSETHPTLTSAGDLVYQSSKSGIVNLYIINASTGSEWALTNLPGNMLTYGLGEDGQVYYSFYRDQIYSLYLFPLNTQDVKKPFDTNLASSKKIKEDKVQDKQEVTYTEIPEHLKFQSRFQDISPALTIISQFAGKSEGVNEATDDLNEVADKIMAIKSNGITAAGLRFRIDKLTARMDNEILFEGLELAQGQNKEVNQIPMGFLAKAAFTDIFEDYRFEAGTRISTNLDGAEFFLTYENKKKLIDKRWAVYLRNQSERSEIEFIPPLKSKKQTLIGMYNVRYPLNLHHSIRAAASLRFDKQYYKATEITTLSEASVYEKRVGLRLEYVFDNTFQYATNLLHGARCKIYTEVQNQFNFEPANNFNIDLNQGFTTVLGMDARYYQGLLNHSVLAVRLTSATSFGSKPNIYYLGNVNNTIFPSFDNSVPLPENRDFAFKSNVPHLRGFKSNIRNGSSYALLNTEFRLPLFMYLLGKDKGASMLRNFQLIAFFDAGLAWYGAGPYSAENPLNSVQVKDVLIELDIQYFRDPLVMGYGWGARTQLLGYFIRLDVAKGIETKKSLPTMYHIGIGLDF